MNELEKDMEGSGRGLIKELYLYFPEGTEGDKETFRLPGQNLN
jgi:hypothetical protein